MKCKSKKAQIMLCWRVAWGVGIPAWVARKCHSTFGHQLTVNGFNGVSFAKEGDVILAVDPEQKEVAHVSKEDFELQFEVVEE